MITISDWGDLKRSLHVGSIVSCVVIRHAPYGFLVDIHGTSFKGLVQITDFKDEGRVTMAEFPPIDSKMKAVVLGFQESTKEVWLGVKPSQLARAGAVDWPSRRSRTIRVGLKVDMDGKIQFFGLEDINTLLESGARILRIEPGEALMTRVEQIDEFARLRISGFSVRVLVEDQGSS